MPFDLKKSKKLPHHSLFIDSVFCRRSEIIYSVGAIKIMPNIQN